MFAMDDVNGCRRVMTTMRETLQNVSLPFFVPVYFRRPPWPVRGPTGPQQPQRQRPQVEVPPPQAQARRDRQRGRGGQGKASTTQATTE